MLFFSSFFFLVMISEVAMRKQQLETRQLASPRMCTRAIKRSGTMQNTRAVIPVYRRVILAPERRTLPLTLYCSRHKTDWPCETMSQHMINIYLCLPVRWKKDNLLLMHLCYYSYLSPSEMREQRRAGSSWIWTPWNWAESNLLRLVSGLELDSQLVSTPSFSRTFIFYESSNC